MICYLRVYLTWIHGETEINFSNNIFYKRIDLKIEITYDLPIILIIYWYLDTQCIVHWITVNSNKNTIAFTYWYVCKIIRPQSNIIAKNTYLIPDFAWFHLILILDKNPSARFIGRRDNISGDYTYWLLWYLYGYRFVTFIFRITLSETNCWHVS